MKLGGNGGTAAEAGGAEGQEAVSGAADPAGGAAGGGRGAAGLRAEELHAAPAPRHEQNAAGPRHVRKPHADLPLHASLHPQVRVTNDMLLLLFLLLLSAQSSFT